VVAAGVLGAAGLAWANGGPFVVKYPNGDPAAKGVLARIDPDLKPAREERLRVVKEDLKILFIRDPMQGFGRAGGTVGASGVSAATAPALEEKMPLAAVSAIYTIENPTDGEVQVDFGFPILRGIYVHPFSMVPMPDVRVQLDKDWIQANVISNSIIYGIIRQRSQEAIDKALAADPELARLVTRVRTTSYVRQRAREAIQGLVGARAGMAEAAGTDESLSRLMGVESDAKDSEREAARQALMDYLVGTMKWAREPAVLMVEYASVDPGAMSVEPADRRGRVPWLPDGQMQQTAYMNMGRLAAIGEQKTTQLYAELAARFDPSVKTAYEAIFSAWGGDVRERSVDFKSGEVRPREIVVDPKMSEEAVRRVGASDPTIYARVNYLDPNARLTAGEKASCEAILRSLPVVFTFAPMNLVHYQVKFPARSTKTLTVSYRQYAYADTREPASYQLAYVVHPASMWKEFGPIELEVAVPEGVGVRASVPCSEAGVEERAWPEDMPRVQGPQAKMKVAVFRGTVAEKTGELFVGLDAESWKKAVEPPRQTVSDGQKPAPGLIGPTAMKQKAVVEK
jgi:hypothetical protein